MEIKNNQCFNINESDGLTKLKLLNSALMKELRKYKEENTKLKHENEILNSKVVTDHFFCDLRSHQDHLLKK